MDFIKLSEEFFKVSNVSQSDEKAQRSIGVSNVMNYVLNHYPTKEIDFHSFSIEDINLAFLDFHFLPNSEDELTAEDKSQLKNHPWAVFLENEAVIAGLVRNVKRIYENEDDFI
jgi:hypothetical protein